MNIRLLLLTPFKVWDRGWRLARSLALTLLYKALPGVFFHRCGWGGQFFGSVRFGSIGNNNISMGRHCMIGKSVFLSASPGANLVIGDGVAINTGCHVVAVYGIHIGAQAAIAEYVSIRDQNHDFSKPEGSVRDGGYTGAPIHIGQGVWLGRGVFVGPGVTIGDYAVVGANSVVTHSIPAHAVAVGAPAKVIRMRTGAPEKVEQPN